MFQPESLLGAGHQWPDDPWVLCELRIGICPLQSNTQRCHKSHVSFSLCPPFISSPSFLLCLRKCTQRYFRGTLNYNTKNITTLESPRAAEIKVLRAESIFSAG